ncbi:MAG: T9SS type A sorting domain-containing protein [Bacteroidetes bacterium]|nr:T9SS type A sorting domain-containing protein [Bacteroidota bacterium]
MTITHPTPTELHSTGLSSVQILPNNNVLICSGRWGYTFEITPDNEIVWEYKTPLRGGNPVSQGDTLLINDNLTFRFKRIPTDYPAFEGKDLSPKGWIELNPDSNFCELILSVDEDGTGTDLVPKQFELSQNYPNPFNPLTHIAYALPTDEFVNLTIYNVLGRTITTLVNEQKHAGSYNVSFNAFKLPSGVYFYKLIAGNYVSIKKMMLLK